MDMKLVTGITHVLMYSQNEIGVIIHISLESNRFSLETFHLTRCLTTLTSQVSCLVLYQYPNVIHCYSLQCHFALIHTFVKSHSLYQQPSFKHEMPSEFLVIELVLGSATKVYRLLGFNFICANKRSDLITKPAASVRPSYYSQHIPHRFLIKLSVCTTMILWWQNTETCVHDTRLSQHTEVGQTSVTIVLKGLKIHCAKWKLFAGTL
jgi:hypothetical protein